jgi:ATP-binding cassette subfamily B protein
MNEKLNIINSSAGKNLPQLLRQLWHKISSRRRRQIGLLCGVMLLASIAEVISIGAILPFLGILTAPQRIFENANLQPVILSFGITKPTELMLPITLGFCLAVLLSGLLRLLLLRLTTKVSFATGTELSMQIYRRTLYQPYPIHALRNSSEVVSAIATKTDAVIYGILNPALNAFAALVIAIVILGVLFFLEPLFTLIAFSGFGLIYLTIVRLTVRYLEENGKKISKDSSQVIRSLQEGLGGIRDVLIDGSQDFYCRIYEKADRSLRQAQGSNAFISNSPKFAMESLGTILIASIAFGITEYSGGIGMVVPIIGLLALGAQRLLPLLQSIYHSWASIKGNQESLVVALALLDQPMPLNESDNSIPNIEFNKNIKLSSVSYRYSNAGDWVLKNINIKIKKGSKIGVIGRTGGGKSTLLDILMSLLAPDLGRLEVDGVVIDEKNRTKWQSRIAHVPQSIFLADISVAENIAFGVHINDIDFERVKKAAAQAQIAETIEEWERGYLTKVGERGVRLSGGQRQRIGIARALYKHADVLVFDEATSALDGETENLVMNELDKLGQNLTIVMIAHRISTLINCDWVIEIEDGKVKREGSSIEILSGGLQE